MTGPLDGWFVPDDEHRRPGAGRVIGVLAGWVVLLAALLVGAGAAGMSLLAGPGSVVEGVSWTCSRGGLRALDDLATDLAQRPGVGSATVLSYDCDSGAPARVDVLADSVAELRTALESAGCSAAGEVSCPTGRGTLRGRLVEPAGGGPLTFSLEQGPAA